MKPDRKFNVFIGATLISRAVGYARDLVIAHFIGGGFWADIYFACFRLANFFRGLLGEGGLYAAYTPVYSALRSKNEPDANKFAWAYAGRLLAALILITALGIAAAGPLTRLLLFGFRSDTEKMIWAVTLTKILMPFLLFITLAAWAQATLQAQDKFFLSSLSPVFLSLAILAYFGWNAGQTAEPSQLLIGLGWATTTGGLLQGLILWPQLRRGLGPSGWGGLRQSHPELQKALLLLGPYALMFSLDQIHSFLGTFLGSFAETGTVAAFYNSGRLIQLPLGLVGVGSLVTSLPEMSRHAAAQDARALRDSLRRQVRRILSIQMPFAGFYILFGSDILRILYRHGRFDEQALALTAAILGLTAPSLVFYSLQKAYLSLFYAHQDTRSLIKTSAAQLAAGVLLGTTLLGLFGARGIATAVTVSSIVGWALMALTAKRKGYAGAS